ncbi:MAG: response regulator, partial [Ruthenibacterium sp.]
MLTLLLVDDDADILRGLEKTINWQQCGITKIVTAQNGLEALRITEKMPIDIMITDVKMPGMDGLKLTETLRAQGSPIEVILLSGFADF